MTESRRPASEAIGLAAFKAHLSAYLRRVRRGELFTILYRDLPIARVLPWTDTPTPLASRPARRGLHSVVLPRAGTRATLPRTDSLGALTEERRERR
jgi:antitoxin (DNA-binding transcriptional repressor) of toxin-antitoxin stability system